MNKIVNDDSYLKIGRNFTFGNNPKARLCEGLGNCQNLACKSLSVKLQKSISHLIFIVFRQP